MIKRKTAYGRYRSNTKINFTITDNLTGDLLDQGYVKGEIKSLSPSGASVNEGNFLLKDIENPGRLPSIVRVKHRVVVCSVRRVVGSSLRPNVRAVAGTISKVEGNVVNTREILIEKKNKRKTIKNLKKVNTKLEYLNDVILGNKSYSRYTAYLDNSLDGVISLAGDGGASNE